MNCVLVPIAALVVPDDSAFAMSAYGLTLTGKIMCYALCAVALDLVWGYCGVLSLGHGLFFALGGYAMGMYLMRQIGREGVYQSDLPDFMVFLDWKALPWFWQGSDSFLWAIAMIVLVPGVIAFVFGWFAFRSRVKGVYLSIITQALTYAAMLLFFRNDTGFGGNNGFTDFKRILGFPIAAIETRVALFVATGLALAGGAGRVPRDRALEARPRRHGDPRRRVARDVHRLRPAALQALRLDVLGRAVRHRRARSTCRRSASSTRARWRRPTRSRW